MSGVFGSGAYQVQSSANNLNLNQGSDTVLATFFVARKAVVRRYGVVSEASQGLLAPSVLNLSYSSDGGANQTAYGSGSTLAVGSARSRGVPVYRNVTTRIEVPAGSTISVRAGTAAGGTSTGRVWIEYDEEPFNGAAIPSNAVAV